MLSLGFQVTAILSQGYVRIGKARWVNLKGFEAPSESDSTGDSPVSLTVHCEPLMIVTRQRERRASIRSLSVKGLVRS